MADDTTKLLEERGKQHGKFADNAKIAQELKWIIRSQTKYHCGPGEGANLYLRFEHREALDMILHKISRIMAGDHNLQDHWDDIAGYAKLGSQACKPKS